jgi:type II secretory pathway pseudopilin PulG
MWRLSRKPLRGFSLAEATVSLTLLIIVMVVSLTLLFSMRSFAERQQFVMEPRQTARRAVEYLSYFLEGAADLNAVGGMPNAIVTYYNSDASNPASLTQASYNNLRGTEAGNASVSLVTPLGTIPSTNFGDLGTDIISVAVPTVRPGKYAVFGAFPANGANRDLWINFREGCGVSDAENLRLFKLATFGGPADGDPSPNTVAVVDSDGVWAYLKINSYVSPSNCASPDQPIHVIVSPGQAPLNGGPLAPPNGPFANPAVGGPAFLVTGLQYFSFRVRTDAATGIPNLEQKNGLFDPVTDKPGAAFVPVIENVEDLQIAYMYQSGAVWNSVVQTMSAGMADCAPCLIDVPFQAGPAGVLSNLDIRNVAGLRFSIVGRSRPMTLQVRTQTDVSPAGAPGSTRNRHFRPAVEDHVAATTFDNFEHVRLTTTLMLRNRIPMN